MIPVSVPCMHQNPMVAPMLQIRRKAYPDMSLALHNRPMNQREPAAEPSRKQTSILILRRKHSSHSRERMKIFRNRQRNKRTAFAERYISNRKLSLLLQPDDSRVFQSPSFLVRIMVSLHRWLIVNLPVGQTVFAFAQCQMRKSTQIFHSCKQQRTIRQFYRSRIKNRIYRIRPVVGIEYRIAVKPLKKVAG